jgi:hypothetical protein
MSFGALLAVLLAIAIGIFVAGVAAVVTVPASGVLLLLVLGWRRGLGARIRGWAFWRRVRGLEPERPLLTFATLLALYGIVIPGACLAIVVAAVRGSSGGSGGAAGTPPVTSSFGATVSSPLPAASAPPATASSAAAVTPAPTPAPPADPCHTGGVTYCALNPAVTQAAVAQTICVRGWTSTIRPPESYTESLKRQQIAHEGLAGGLSSYEEDHRMPLELGGAPSDVMNLSPELGASPNPKDSDETSLKTAVCDGQLTLAQAQQRLVATWLAPYPKYVR